MAHVRIVESTAAALRLAEAQTFLKTHIQSGGALIVSAARGAADDLARSLAVEHRATLGLHRFSFAHLAARFAEPVLAARDLAQEATAVWRKLRED